MNPRLIQKNIVVNGQFNVGLLDKHFFIKHDIISEEIFAKLKYPAIFNGFNSQIATDEFIITINPIQLVINSIKPEIKINKILISIINASGSNNFQSFGINFDWILEFESKEMLQKKSKEYFFNENTKLMSTVFNTDDSHYGFYGSKDVLDSRLKLDIKPISTINYPEGATVTPVPIDALYHQFNFHFTLNAANILLFLEKYENYQSETENIIFTYK